MNEWIKSFIPPHFSLDPRCLYFRFREVGDEAGVDIDELRFYVTKFTPKGAWIWVYGEKKFILGRAKKKFAYPTRKQALENFIFRKHWQRILSLKRADIALEAERKAGKMLKEMKDEK